jgi:hypothetical protein
MKSGELDKRVGEYAAAIVRDVDLLLADAANLNDQQHQVMDALKHSAVRFLSFYNESMLSFAEGTVELSMVAFHLRLPLSSIHGYCDLLLSGELGSWNQSQAQLLQQIKTVILSLTPLLYG